MRVFWLVVSLFCSGTLCAAPLFIQRHEEAQPDEEAVSKALEQVREHKEIKIRDDLKVPPFHKQVDDKVKEGEAFCQGCHLPVPHSKKLRTRAFLNMHTRYIACETCHFRPEDARFDFRWLDYAKQQPAPEQNRFRTGKKIDNAHVLDGNTKIVPFFQSAPAIAFPGSAFAEEIARQWKDADEAGKSRLKAKLHAPLKKEGPACGRCHGDKDPLLDLQALGAEPDQATAIQKHLIPQFFGRYQKDDERIRIINLLN